LSRPFRLRPESATGRVSLVNFPYPVDPFRAASVASMVEAAEPRPDGPRVGEAFRDLTEEETIDVKIIVDHRLMKSSSAKAWRSMTAGMVRPIMNWRFSSRMAKRHFQILS
jgi:hypothetical protein